MLTDGRMWLAPVAAGLWLLRAGAPGVEDIRLRYVANAGVLATVEGRSFLIDAPIREGIAPYATSPAEERRRLESASAPYDDVAAILITHWHEDHLSAEAVAAHLASNPHAMLVSSPEVIARVHAAGPTLPAARLRAVLPQPGHAETTDVAGVTVRVLRIRHNPARRVPEQHVGFLIGADAAVLHVGDADPRPDNFAVLRGLPKVDLALLPFWYVLDEPGRAFVRDAIGPRRVFAMHVPPADAAGLAGRLGAGVATVPPQPGRVVSLPGRAAGDR